MADVKLTPARAEVLRGVAAGQVVRWGSMDTSAPDVDRWTWSPGAARKVNREMAALHDAGLVRYEREAGRLHALWQLTEAGEKWLAENEENA
ncbi:hypothetical protein [Actinoplanes sp. NPDC020271]|uniref:hypothetical protein n=1 Tax=Actinoplanes sp. NPDC020271 TaxID=3363896 RepID=UPI0037A27E20